MQHRVWLRLDKVGWTLEAVGPFRTGLAQGLCQNFTRQPHSLSFPHDFFPIQNNVCRYLLVNAVDGILTNAKFTDDESLVCSSRAILSLVFELSLPGA